MDRREIAALLAYIGRLDPRTIRTDEGEARYQVDQWHALLGDVPMATPYGWDARIAAHRHIRTSQYPILPADIGRPWDGYKRDRLSRHTDPTPCVDPDDQAAWTAELIGTRRAVAAGHALPAQDRAITSVHAGPDPQLQKRLREIGSPIPPAARAALAPLRPARAAREASVAQGHPDPLGVRCDWCQAQVDEPCRRRRVGLDGSTRGGALMSAPHPSRLDLAAQQTPQPAPA